MSNSASQPPPWPRRRHARCSWPRRCNARCSIEVPHPRRPDVGGGRSPGCDSEDVRVMVGWSVGPQIQPISSAWAGRSRRPRARGHLPKGSWPQAPGGSCWDDVGYCSWKRASASALLPEGPRDATRCHWLPCLIAWHLAHVVATPPAAPPACPASFT